MERRLGEVYVKYKKGRAYVHPLLQEGALMREEQLEKEEIIATKGFITIALTRTVNSASIHCRPVKLTLGGWLEV